MDLTAILDDCLERLARGESRAEVLARYPDDAHALAPALDAAAQLAALAAPRLTHGQRLRAKMALRKTLAAAHEPRPVPLFGRLRLLPTALILAIVLISALSVSAVASSQPGDATYAVRMLAERVPALVKFTPASRAAAELDAADRRLDDLGRYLAASGQAHPAALDALLKSEQAAVHRALRSQAAERDLLARRMTAQANELDALATRSPNPQAAAKLYGAAQQTRDLARDLEAGDVPATPRPTPTGSTTGAGATPPTPANVPPAEWTEPARIPLPSATPGPRATDIPLPTATRTLPPHPRLTALPTQPGNAAPSASATPLIGRTPQPARTRPTDWTRRPTRTSLPTRTPRPTWTPQTTRTPLAQRTLQPTRTPVAPGFRRSPTPASPPDTPAPTDTALPATNATPQTTPAPTDDTAGEAARTPEAPDPPGPPPRSSPEPGGPGPRHP